MGRGLSELQRWILQKAGERENLYPVEIFAEFYGWPLVQPIYRFGDGTHLKLEAERHGEPDGAMIPFQQSQYFSRQAIGAKEYQRGMVTVSRAVSRLMRRGLLNHGELEWVNGRGQHSWSGRVLWLTEQGETWLSDNTAYGNKNVVTSVNQ
jgi:hypothetical protein